jgi:mxaL protein
MASPFRDMRFILPVAAVATFAAAIINPTLTVQRSGVDALVVIDITGSMNVRDYHDGERPISRLDAVKAALRVALTKLPCPSRIALAVFAERRPFLLFEPTDVRAHYAPVESAIAALDWRMAWEGDSRISAGLFRAFDMAREMDADLLFFTDGQEAPPLPAGSGPRFAGDAGALRGLIVGVGGYALSPIPKFDDNGHEIGFFGAEDVPHENRFGLPPQGAELREGYDARNAPFGGTMRVGVEHLSSVKEDYLQSLAATTGLAYAHFDDAARLVDAYLAVATARRRDGETALRPLLALLGAGLLFSAYALSPLVESIARRTPFLHRRKEEHDENHPGSHRRFAGDAGRGPWADADQGERDDRD